MYFVIDYLTNPSVSDPEEGPFLEIHEEDISIEGADAWQTGERFEGPLATPLEIEATPHEGYQGPPHDYFDGSIAFMSPRLVKVLQRNGVDNLDLYPAVVRYRTTGEAHEVFAFNLLGLVSAVDRRRSKVSRPASAAAASPPAASRSLRRTPRYASVALLAGWAHLRPRCVTVFPDWGT